MKRIYAAGVFDIIHGGHIRFLNEAKALGDVLIVGLLTDEAAARYKSKPIMTFEERWEVLAAIHCVDYVVRQEDSDPTETLISLQNDHHWKIDILVRATDCTIIPPGTAFIEKRGGKVVRVPYTYSISSSIIKKRILHG